MKFLIPQVTNSWGGFVHFDYPIFLASKDLLSKAFQTEFEYFVPMHERPIFFLSLGREAVPTRNHIQGLGLAARHSKLTRNL